MRTRHWSRVYCGSWLVAARDALKQNIDEAIAWDAPLQALVVRRQLAVGVTCPHATGWDPVHDAAPHLMHVVGVGPHGLPRMGTGNWDDGIDHEAPDRGLAIQSGESAPNTQEALVVVPLAADLRHTTNRGRRRSCAPKLRRCVKR